MNPGLLRAYQYVVALVAIHMVVLGVVNVLRTLAEIALGATSGGFTGLPFLFAEGRNQPLDLHREHLSLAISLLLVGGIAWWLHWRAAQRGGDRASSWRAFYLQTVLFITALLVAGYGADALSRVLRAWLIDPLPQPEGILIFEGFDPWPARVAGALAMVLAAAGAWWWHARVADADRVHVGPSSRAASLRRFSSYLLLAIAVLLALFPLVSLTQRASRELVGPPAAFQPPAGVERPEGAPLTRIVVEPERGIRQAVVDDLPDSLAGFALVIAYRRRAEAIARVQTAEGEGERRSRLRQTGFGFLLLTLGVSGLAAAAGALSAVLRQLAEADPGSFLAGRLSDAIPSATILLAGWAVLWWTWQREPGRELAPPSHLRRAYLYVALALLAATWLFNVGGFAQQAVAALADAALPQFGSAVSPRDVVSPLPFALLFGLAWWYHRRFVRDRAEPRWARQAYQHLFVLVSLAAWAIGLAGTVGVLGSFVLGQQTHEPLEIGLYLALLGVGFPAWALQWRAVRRDLAPEDRRTRIRRLSLGLAAFGGVVALLAFGAGALFRLLNSLLGFSFEASALHDLWHLLADAGTGALVAGYHWRATRSERAAEPPPAAAPAPRPFLVVVPAGDAAARERILAAAGPGARLVETDDPAEALRRLERD